MKNKNDDNYKKKQVRKTHYDTLMYQKKLRKIIKDKIKNDDLLTDKECDEWDEIIAISFSSVGTNKKVFYDTPNIKICFGTIHTFALRFSDWNTKQITYTYKNKPYKFEIRLLWKLLYDYCLELFPYALADAIRMSKESEEHESWDGYSFSSKRELNGDN